MQKAFRPELSNLSLLAQHATGSDALKEQAPILLANAIAGSHTLTITTVGNLSVDKP